MGCGSAEHTTNEERGPPTAAALVTSAPTATSSMRRRMRDRRLASRIGIVQAQLAGVQIRNLLQRPAHKGLNAFAK
eukprot:11477539-Alexandrium_andersonii.AAC.1